MTSIVSIAGFTVGLCSLALVLVAGRLIATTDKLVSRIERLDAAIRDSKDAVGGLTDALEKEGTAKK